MARVLAWASRLARHSHHHYCRRRLHGIHTDTAVVADTDALWNQVADLLPKRGENATHDPEVGSRIREMINRRRDEWLRRVHNQTDHKLCYKSEGGATVGLLENTSDRSWEMFTCLNSLRDVEGTVDLVLDQSSAGMSLAEGD